MLSKFLKIMLILVFSLLFSFTGNQVFAQNKKIVLATDPWEPHYGPNLVNNGYFTELVKEAFKKTGYDCEIKFVPWKRALEKAKDGYYDGLLGAFYNDERTNYFKYSEPISETQMVFFSKKESGIQYNNLKDLSRYKIGVIRGYKYTEEFDTATYLKKEDVTRIEQNIRKLFVNRIDLFIDSKDVTLWTLRTKLPNYIDSLEIIAPPLKTNKLYVPISKKIKNYEQIVNDLNKGLQLIKEEGTYDKIMKHRGF